MPHQPMVFAELGKEYFKKRETLIQCHELSTSSFRADEIRWGKILPVFGSKWLPEITTHDVDRFLDELICQGKAPATRNRYRALLHNFFGYAHRAGQVENNPVAGIPALSEKVKTRKVGHWQSQDEIDRYVRAGFKYRPVFGVIASMLGLAGIRIAEALALRWEDVEWAKGYLRIRIIVERHSREVCERTKGQKSGGHYYALLSERLIEVLMWWKQQAEYFLPSDYVAAREDGRHFTYDQYRLGHQRMVKRAGLPMITIHDIRRTFAMLCERAGMSRSDITQLLGHETAHTVDDYLPPDPGYVLEKAARVMG